MVSTDNADFPQVQSTQEQSFSLSDIIFKTYPVAAKDNIVTNFTEKTIINIYKFTKNYNLIGSDFSSFREIYEFAYFIKIYEPTNKTTILYPKNTHFTDNEYAFLASYYDPDFLSMNNLVDFGNENKVFDRIPFIFDIPEIKSNFTVKMHVLRMYSILYTYYAHATRKQLEKVNKSWKSNEKYLFLDYFGQDYENIRNYTRYQPDSNVKWNAKKINNDLPEIPAFADQLVTKEEFLKEIELFSDNYQFDLPNNNICGGSVLACLDKFSVKSLKKLSDLDIFITVGSTKEEIKENFNKTVEYFDKKYHGGVYYALLGSMVNVYLKNNERKFQILSTAFKDIYDTISSFDLTNIKLGFCYEKGSPHLYMHVDSIYTITKRTASITKMNSHKISRSIKTLLKGYNLENYPILTNIFEYDLNQIFMNIKSEDVQNVIMDAYIGYTPKEGESDEIIKHMIKKITFSTMTVTMDKNEVLEKIIYNGNFVNNYTSFQNSHIISSAIKLPEIMNSTNPVKYGGKELRVQTGKNTLISYVSTDTEYTFIISPNDTFKKIICEVEDAITKIYPKHKTSQPLIYNEKNQLLMKIVVQKDKLEYKTHKRFGEYNEGEEGGNNAIQTFVKSFITDQNGLPSDLEDLENGEKLDFVVSLNFRNKPREKYIIPDVKRISREMIAIKEKIEQPTNRVKVIETKFESLDI